MPTPSLRLSPAPSQCSLATFLKYYGEIYEHSPWVAEAAWQQGLNTSDDDPDKLAERMGDVLRQANKKQQIGVIKAHPDLAGKAAIAGELTRASREEQAGAGLDQCSPEEFDRFKRLNEAYQEAFDFPFVIAVKGLDRQAILEAFAERLENDRETERQTAIEQIVRIAHLRLNALAESA